jgi:hypothetical protein
MLFLRNLLNNIIKQRIFLCYGLAVVIFFILHIANTWGILGKEELRVFFYLMGISIFSIGSAILVFILMLFREKEDKKILSIPLFTFIAILWLAVIFFVNIDIICKFNFDKIKFIYYSFVDITKALAITLLFFASSYAVGKKLLLFFKSTVFSEAEEVLLSLALGMGFWGNAFFLLGVLRLGYTWIAYGLVLAAIIGGWRDIRKIFFEMSRKKIEIPLARKRLLEKIAVLMLLILFLLIFIYSLSNLMSAGWDTLHQYLTFSDAYQKNHGLVYFQFHPQWGSPQLAEMIFFEGLLLGGIKIPFLMNYFFVLLGFWGFSQAVKKGGSKNNIWSLAILAGIPLLLSFQAGNLKVEGLLLFYSMIIFIIAQKLLLPEADRKKLWVLLALFLGLSMSIKYTSMFAIAGVVVAFWFLRKKVNFDWKKLFLMAMIIFAVFSPWLLKNVIYYKSPLYPLFTGKDYVASKLGINCGGYFLSACKEDVFFARQDEISRRGHRLMSHIPFWSNILIILRSSFSGDFDGMARIGPFFIIFLPVVFWSYFQKKEPYMKFLAIFALVYFVLGMIFFTGQVWYFMPGMTAYLLLVAYALPEKNAFAKLKLFKIIILTWLFISISIYAFNAKLYTDNIPYIQGEKNLEEVFSQDNLYKMSEYVNANILTKNNPRALIYGFTNPHGYFIKDSHKKFITDFYGHLFTCLSQDGRAYENMKKLGVTHIILYTGAYPFCAGEDAKLFTCQAINNFRLFIDRHGELIHSEEQFSLYRLR